MQFQVLGLIVQIWFHLRGDSAGLRLNSAVKYTAESACIRVKDSSSGALLRLFVLREYLEWGSFHFTLLLPEGLKSTSNTSPSNFGRQHRFPSQRDYSGRRFQFCSTGGWPIRFIHWPCGNLNTTGSFKEHGNGPTSLTLCSSVGRRVSNEYLT